MARKLRKCEADAVSDVCAAVHYRASVNAPVSFALRGRLVRHELANFQEIVGRDLDKEMIGYFCPDVERRTGRSVDWLIRRIWSIRSGRGCGQSTFSALLPIFWRLPRFGWPVLLPPPPWSGYDMPTRVNGGVVIQRADGSQLPFPPMQKGAA